MKKFVALIISAIMCCSLFSGCGNQSELDSLREENSSLRAKLEKNSAKSDSYVESKLEESEESSSTFSQPETSEPSALSKYEKYVKENNIILDNYDVQYDMGNNLNTQYFFEESGYADYIGALHIHKLFHLGKLNGYLFAL